MLSFWGSISLVAFGSVEFSMDLVCNAFRAQLLGNSKAKSQKPRVMGVSIVGVPP